ncbi:MAG TPA: hypothetical protein DCS17_09150 [Flavobacterium sp.]|nr:hypothetical protein [Flavobacterium sp.]
MYYLYSIKLKQQIKQNIMKAIFYQLCNKYFILPSLAIENESVKNILKNENLNQKEKTNELDYILGTEF